MIIEGFNSVMEALKSNNSISKILIKKNDMSKESIRVLAENRNIKVQFVDAKILDSESKTKHHQGVLAVVDDYNYFTLDDILEESNKKNESNFIVILDGIEDPHNFGSIIRTCECLGVHGIVIGKNRCCPVNETVVKTSVGAINHIKVARVTNINNAIETLKSKNVWVYACELGGKNVSQINFSGNVAIVMGSEGKGVSTLTKKLCDDIVSIDMKGRVNSLNVSVATGIILHEISKIR